MKLEGTDLGARRGAEAVRYAPRKSPPLRFGVAPDYLTLRPAAVLSGMEARSVLGLLRAGVILGHPEGGRWLVYRPAFDVWTRQDAEGDAG